MSNKRRLRKRLADLDTEDEIEPIEVHSKNTQKNQSKELTIKNKFALNEVHTTALDLCMYEKTKMVFIDGPAGSCKSFISVLAALNLLQQKKIKKIIYIRSIVESAEKSIGALPGELDEKFKPWSLPLLDKLHELIPPFQIDTLMESGQIQCIPVNFVRGLTFHDAAVIVDESQNNSYQEEVTILTRFGHNTRYFVIGDTKQTDTHKSGFKSVLERFSDEECQEHGIYVCHFGENEIVRSKILRLITRKLNVS